MKHFIIGTAGHVDHGKTMLIKALTGKDTDRLKEEKERGISIELGFAPFQLPSGELAGVVDVPGHERFIKNMLAGVSGMDMVLLIIAADEGIMPQTVEHLDIIDLLQITNGILVITKADLVEEDWLDLVKEEVRELVAGTTLEKAPLAVVSASTGQGISELKALIDSMAFEIKERSAAGQARMPVDRVFSMTGFGTVVTGTMIEGHLQLGNTVQILPENIEARIRGLQVHGQKVDSARAGQRVAVNLAGLERGDIDRGSLLATPGYLKPSHRIDAIIKLLLRNEKALVNRARVRVHIGAAEILARVILLESDELEPGNTGLAQFECEHQIVAARGDKLVIRSYSPMRTIGGGKVIDPVPPKRKRFDPGIIEALRTRDKGTPEEIVEQTIISSGRMLFTGEELAQSPGVDRETVLGGIKGLISGGRLRHIQVDNKVHYVLEYVLRQKAAEMTAVLGKFHAAYPLRTGISKEEIRSRFFGGLNNKLFSGVMELYRQEGIIKTVGENISLADFEPGPGKTLEQVLQKIEERYKKSGFQTPGWDEVAAEFKLNQGDSEELMNYCLNNRVIVKLEDNVFIHTENLERARDLITKHLRQHSEISLGEARDLLQTSRKFALPILSYFDKIRLTRRLEDKRVLY